MRTGDGERKVEDMVEVVANSRVNSHMVPEADTLECEAVGTCEWHSALQSLSNISDCVNN